ncbi:tRNA 2-selenouridine(34) synthase MnmH [Virgibacillus phasianinus]|uniref:tRNA 2-selenouridine(34) synthase MnmH n=1 Tax=Virgibacillus phasianinus TaxID=2017483 RepID=A0A220U0A0_9BACI|nr:tRNA 2-selenouridine(34) synthase MnmH [Virgibacillus phasianinus]ASK61509.1 tRNA 2-selenouridine(34) synthase MnmH [Virgibacillus phasianinus]
MVQDISLNKLFEMQSKENHTMIDVRSPKEFEEATIPGSINIPVFDNDERAEVGTIYKQKGPDAAKERGLEIFSAKLPDFIKTFSSIKTSKTVFCWRGGMRSKTAATVLDLMGNHAFRLSGGIRSYRQWVVQSLNNFTITSKAYVINGYTGSGKTILLEKLQESGYPVLDLEGMASHRGSIFGQIGLKPSNQKKFESLLLDRLLHYQNSPFIFMEGESKRIGKVTIPDFLYNHKEEGTQIFINLPTDERVKNILDDYQPWNYPEKFMEAFLLIKKRIHTPIAKAIHEHLANEEFSSAVQLLLEYYYDPRYEHAAKAYSDDKKIMIYAQTIDEAFNQIQHLLKEKEYNVR